jgi:uncharacterized coiled-coil DUF342 family protein
MGKRTLVRNPGRDGASRRRLSDLAVTRDRALQSHEGLLEWDDALRSVHHAIRETRDDLRQYEQGGDFGARSVALAPSLAHVRDRRGQLRRKIDERLAVLRPKI